MSARVVPPYPEHPEDTSMVTHIECRACGIEWGWAKDVPSAYERLERLAHDHNVEVHGHRRIL